MKITISTSSQTKAPEPSPKQRALRDLNTETRSQQVALNQIINTATHALRDLEDKYQRKRTHIINQPDPEPQALHLVHGIDQ